MRLHDRLQPSVSNSIPPVAAPMVTGVIGDAPSTYSRTPQLWNALYHDLGWDAVSLAWDVTPEALPQFVIAARGCEELAGFNVTNPHKIAILPLLDGLDDNARRVGAVNTVVRTPAGALLGANTDGHGAVAALSHALPGRSGPFVDPLRDRRVLIVGAGGAARAIAFALGPLVGPTGLLRIANRDPARATALAAALQGTAPDAEGGGEDRIAAWARDATLVINSSSKGQAGWRVTADGRAYQLEPYSSLAPCMPATLAPGTPLTADALREWRARSAADIEANARASLEMVATMRPGTPCFDVVYVPAETRFLAHARHAGHPTLNGRWMIIAQAAAAFAYWIGAGALRAHAMDPDVAYRHALGRMSRAW